MRGLGSLPNRESMDVSISHAIRYSVLSVKWGIYADTHARTHTRAHRSARSVHSGYLIKITDLKQAVRLVNRISIWSTACKTLDGQLAECLSPKIVCIVRMKYLLKTKSCSIWFPQKIYFASIWLYECDQNSQSKIYLFDAYKVIKSI